MNPPFPEPNLHRLVTEIPRRAVEFVGFDFGFCDEAGLLRVREYGVDVFVFEAVVDGYPEVACGFDCDLDLRIRFQVCDEFFVAVWVVLESEFFFNSSFRRLDACDAAGFMDI